MTPSFFRRARRKSGATIRIGSQPVTVRVRAVVKDSDGATVRGTFDPNTLEIVIEDGSTPAMRDHLAHEIAHAVIRVFSLLDRFSGEDEDERVTSEEHVLHTMIPALLGGMDQCSARRTP